MDPTRLEEIARRHGVLLVVQFGSTVSGPAHARSDLDLGVLFAELPRSFREVAELTHDLQALSPGREVDLAVLNRADPLFLNRAIERSRLLYGSPRRYHELRCYAFKRYQDHRPYLALEQRYVDRALGRAGAR